MRAYLGAFALVLLIALVPAPAQAQDAAIREAVDAFVELLSTTGDAALVEYAEGRVAPSFRDRLGSTAMMELLGDVRDAALGTLGMIDVGADGDRLVLRLSDERSAELGLELDGDGLVSHLEVLSTEDTSAGLGSELDAAVEQRMLAIEGLPTSGTDGFADEHFTPALRAELDGAERVRMLDRARRAAASAGMVSVERRPDGFVLSFRGGREDLDVVFDVEADAPFRISRFHVVQPDPTGVDEAVRPLRWDELESRLEEAYRASMSGTALVVRGGATLVDRSFGLSDQATGRANDSSTIYAIGSLPIDFTRAAVLLLVQRGDVALDDPVSRYFPNVPDDKAALTVGHLLNHESGLPNFHHRAEEDADFDLTWIDREEAERRILEAELLFEPGTERLPSHSAFGLLAALVERVSGQPYQDFLRTNFFEPLGMDVTGPFGDDFGLPLERFATGYGSSAVGEPNIPPFWGPTSWLVQGSGGMVSNPADMRRWFDGLRGGEILRGDALEAYLNRGSALGASDRGFFFGHFWAGSDDMVFLAINGGSDSEAVEELLRSLMALVAQNEISDR